MFRSLYDRVLAWSKHRHAPYYLCALSAAESSVFPVPPDVMLAPMSLAQPAKAWFFATICTISSVLGGLLGYLIGALAFELIEPWLMTSAYAGAFEKAVSAFDTHGFWYILLAGFTPIPYKVFTVSAGVVGMPPLPFIGGSLAGRGGRFFLVAGLIRIGGEPFAQKLRQWIDLIGYSVLAVAVIAYVVYRFMVGPS
ncbi:MAG: DedA family protein [Gammaproteobacteria bacterium]|nr:DedA family protein [Gammaproteobacteria bacterium]